MTEEQGEALHRMGNKFYMGLSKLVAECLDVVPKEIENEALTLMQDKASVYGSNFEKYRGEKPSDRETVQSLYSRFSKARETAATARNKEPMGSHKQLMLAGKVKAYTEMLSHLKTKYAKQLGPLEPRK